MNDGDFRVDILNDTGEIVTNKLRKDIVKGVDIYHAVYGVIITPEGHVAVSLIAQKEDLPNLHAGSYGFTAATIRRSSETGAEAMKRAILNELNLNTEPELFSELLEDVDGTKRLVGTYLIKSNIPTEYNHREIEKIVSFEPNQFSQEINMHPEKFTPLLKKFWAEYNRS